MVFKATLTNQKLLTLVSAKRSHSHYNFWNGEFGQRRDGYIIKNSSGEDILDEYSETCIERTPLGNAVVSA